MTVQLPIKRLPPSTREIALAAARQLQHREGESVTLSNLGLAYTDLNETRRAIQFFEEALLLDREIGNLRGEGADLGNLGLAYADLVRPAVPSNSMNNSWPLRAQAIHHAGQALIIYEQIEAPHAEQVRAQLAAWLQQTNS